MMMPWLSPSRRAGESFDPAAQERRKKEREAARKAKAEEREKEKQEKEKRRKEWCVSRRGCECGGGGSALTSPVACGVLMVREEKRKAREEEDRKDAERRKQRRDQEDRGERGGKRSREDIDDDRWRPSDDEREDSPRRKGGWDSSVSVAVWHEGRCDVSAS